MRFRVGGREKARTSFLKKRSKKLLSSARFHGAGPGRRRGGGGGSKSLLVLFFRKELLPMFPSPVDSFNGIAGACKFSVEPAQQPSVSPFRNYPVDRPAERPCQRNGWRKK
jgi:hypothetical protein